MRSFPIGKPAGARGWPLAYTVVVKKRETDTPTPRHPCPLLTQSQKHVTWRHAIQINSTVSNFYIFSLTILFMQNSTPKVWPKPVAASINKQKCCAECSCSVLHIWQHSVQATLPAGLCPPVQNAAWQANRIYCEPYILRTVQCCHTAQRTAVAVQHSDYSSDMHIAEHLQHTNTVRTGADIDRRSTVDPPHSTQFPVLTAVAQFDCTGTDSLLQRARFTVWYSTQERHSCTE